MNCSNSRKNIPGIRKFFLPVNDEDRCRKWILLCGNASLAMLDQKQLSQKFLCGVHFSADLLTFTKLPKTALPLEYCETGTDSCRTDLRDYSRNSGASTSRQEEKEELIQDSRKGVMQPLFQLPTTPKKHTEEEIVFLTPEKQEEVSEPSVGTETSFISELIQLPALPEKSTSQCRGMKKDSRENTRNIGDLPFLPKLVVTMQLNHVQRTPWALEEKIAAVTMFYKSPTMYRFLMKQGFILPSVSTLKTYINCYRTKPECNGKLFERLKQKVSTMEDTKMCSVL
ncbi:unnamed protein product [Callosobruchus maculatus]|uniref:THAP-type domain-containing protein n=1 Tax=Callosobruchus maculatus TaxID=64391 RepID=A0A653DF48_CALMS|nr:unnamed protein product [Callosobruchus maculatus]